jgi:alkylhydroperoxidase/carboxymuconolactone decarboxylase family protein YurZ
VIVLRNETESPAAPVAGLFLLCRRNLKFSVHLEGAVHSHVRKALDAGVTPEEIRHAVMLAMPTLGLPTAMAAMTWVDDVLARK